MLSSLRRLTQQQPKGVGSTFLPGWILGPSRGFDAVTALGAETARYSTRGRGDDAVVRDRLATAGEQAMRLLDAVPDGDQVIRAVVGADRTGTAGYRWI